MQHTPTKNRLPTRLTAWLLALLMVATMLPASALATAEDGSTDPPPPAAEAELQTPADPEPSAGADDPIPPADPETPDNPDSPVGADDSVRPEPPETPDNPDPSAGADDPVPPETPADPETPLLTEEQTVSQPAMLAGTGTSGAVRFIFEEDGYNSDQTIRLNSYSYQYITECKPGATVYTVEDQYKRKDFITTGPYVAYMYGSDLYLKGTLNGACINFDQVSGSTAVVYVQEDTTIGGNHCLLYNFQGDVNLRIRPGKTLTLNAQTPGEFRYMGAIRANDGGDVSISGGGTLAINATGSEAAVDPRDFLSGIRGSNVTLENCTEKGFEGSPTVNILMDNRQSGPEGDKVIGISAGKLTVKDDTQLRINVYGRALNASSNSNTGEAYHTGNGGRSNRAISASSMELLNNASLTIFSYKNVISDICLGGSGEVLKVDTSGYLNIRNDGNIERYALDGPGANDAMLATYKDHPSSNIYCSDKDATVNLARAEGGVSIVSYSADIDKWYEDYYEDGQEDADNWAISCHGADPQLGDGMHRGSLRIGESIKVAENSYFRNHGSIEYIWAPQGVATVQQSKGLIMRWETPEGSSSSVYFAKVLKPELNDIRVVRKGESIELTSTGTKGKFLCWYDAQNPEGSETGTDWTNPTQTFTNIQRDMVLVPVRDPMTTGPNLSTVGYSEQYDSDTSTYTRYAYQDLTFEKADSISSGTGEYQVMLVPAQLPTYGKNTYAVKDLKNSPVMGLRSSRLYADKNAAFSVSALNNQFRNIPPGSYRIAYNDDATGRCFFSEPFTFNPPVAPPYIAPGSAVFEEKDSGTKTVTITVERNKHIEYRVWNSSTNKWTSLQRYTGPFPVDVSTSNDVRIEAYAGSSAFSIKSEAYYSVRPSGVPTVKYGDKEISTTAATVPTYNYLGAIELTVEAPEGCEVWYRENYSPSESDMGNKAENGKVVISGTGGSSKTIYFKLAKAFTVNGREYRKLSHSVSKVNLKELTAATLPAPEVTVTPRNGGEPLTPSGNTYTITEFVNVALAKSSGWPLNATLGYAYHGDTAPQNAKPYTDHPFEVRGEQTVSVFALASNADGSIAHQRWLYQFKLDPSVKYVMLIVRNATAYDSNGKVLVTESNGVNASVNVQVGARIKVVPNVPSGKVFKNWDAEGIYDTPNDKFKKELFFTMPDRSSNMLVLVPEFADQSEAYITGDTKVLLTMGPTPQYNGSVMMKGTVGDSVDLFNGQYSEGVDYHALRTISYQWWKGESVGTNDNALPTWETFDKSKTYTVKVTITAADSGKFSDAAGVQFGIYGKFLKMKDVTRSPGGKTLTFVATPLREMKLTLPTLYEGDSLSKVQESFNTQLSPMGYAVDAFTWGSGTPDTAGPAGTTYYINTLKLKLNQNRPLQDSKVIMDGTYCFYSTDSDGKLVVLNNSTQISLKVKPKGVTVSGTVKSYGDAGENVTVTLTKQGETNPAFTDTLTGATGSAPYSQTYSFPTVPAGTYTLKVEKKGHAPWTEEITVDSAAIAKDVTVYLWGDVNKDGEINVTDIVALINHVNGTASLTGIDHCDLDSDGQINVTDVVILINHVNGSAPMS